PATSLANAALSQNDDLSPVTQGIHDDHPFFKRRSHDKNLHAPPPKVEAESWPPPADRGSASLPKPQRRQVTRRNVRSHFTHPIQLGALHFIRSTLAVRPKSSSLPR